MSANRSQIAKNNDKVTFGFWVYLMTDCMLFAVLFATYAVLRNNTAGGPVASDIFSLPLVLAGTLVLLTSSLTSGLMLLAVQRGSITHVMRWLGVTMLLGGVFLGLELYEFTSLVAEGHSWTVSAFLSAFFTLVGTHGLHILIGLIWASVLLWRISDHGLNPTNVRRLTLFGLFWHFLDIIWIFIFSFVYLLGVL